MGRDTFRLREQNNFIAPVGVNVAGAVAPAVNKVIEASNETKILKGLSQSKIDLNNLNNEYRLANEGDPTKNRSEYDKAVKAIFEKNGSSVSSLFKGQWANKADQMATNNTTLMDTWEVVQQGKNAVVDVNSSMLNSYKTAESDGKEYGLGGSELLAKTNYEQAYKELKSTSEKFVGETTMGTLLEDYEKDYMKSFVSGTIQSNPDKGMAILSDEKISDLFDEDEIKDFKDMSEKVKSENMLKDLKITTKNEAEMASFINDESISLLDKQLEIDKQEITGQITTKFATSLKKVAKSKSAVDGVDDDFILAGLLFDIADLKANEESGEKYLKSVGNIRLTMNKQLEVGKLSRKTYNAMNVELQGKTLIKRETEAVDNLAKWGGLPGYYGYNDAYADLKSAIGDKKVSKKALRDYFYSTNGKGYSAKERKQAVQIIAKRNKKAYIDDLMIKSFGTEAEAEAANLPKGTEINIGGKRARIK